MSSNCLQRGQAGSAGSGTSKDLVHPNHIKRENLILYTARKNFTIRSSNREGMNSFSTRVLHPGDKIRLTKEQAKGLIYRGFLTEKSPKKPSKVSSGCGPADCIESKLKCSEDFKFKRNHKPKRNTKNVDISIMDQKLIDESSKL